LGFGWDPIFLPAGSDKTFAEVTTEERGAVSMRAKAVRALKVFLDEQGL
jgi:XTP/dITP diphosphohydrolase